MILQPIKKTRISDDALEQIAELIISGQYKPGDKLPPERDLASQLSITRVSLREALRQMENMKLISVHPGDGIYVEDYRKDACLDFIRFSLSTGVGMDGEMLMSLEEVRRVLAVQMIELATDRIDEENLANLREILDNFPGEATPELLSGEWDYRFFHEIAMATKNRIIVYMLNTIKDIFGQLRWLYSKLDESFESVAELNRKIVDALEQRDKDLAASLLEGRMIRDSELLEKLLDELS